MNVVPQPLAPAATIALQAITLLNTKTLPTDRSIPAVIITKVIPTPKTAKTEMLIMMFLKLNRVKNVLGAIALKIAVITKSTETI